MAVSKVIVNDVTRVDLTQDTVAPEVLITDYTAHNHMGQAIVGTATADNTFFITLSKQNDVWTPACTFAEAQAAYNGGKNLVFQTDGTDTATVPEWHYDSIDGFYYTVAIPFNENPSTGLYQWGVDFLTYHWNGSITLHETYRYYSTESGNASAADVRTGKEFYNADGLQIGTMPNGSATTPATTITANPDISVSPSGVVTATVSASQSITPTVSAGYVSNGTMGQVTVSGSDTLQLSVQGSKTITPSTSSQTAVAAGKYTTGTVTVAAMPTGTAGTPTASKGTVSNHSVSVTPSVTNTTGYITGGTKTGTAVTITAAELESGTKTITENGTNIDVTGYSAVDVNVSQTYTATISGTTGSQNYTYVRHVASGQRYYTDGDTFTYQSGQTLYCRIGDRFTGGGELIIDGTMIDSAYPQGQDEGRIITYNYTLPECDIEIKFGTGASNVDRITITTHPPVTAVPQTVTQNGTYTAPAGNAYSPVIVDVESSGTVAEEKNVNFIDYDGTILYSYTPAEFAQLSALPANPSHAGLIAQGWNWSLADAKTYVAKYGKLNVGQMYITTSGATEIDITLTAPDLHPYLGIAPNGTVVIDWGDNSTTDTVTGTSNTTLKFTGHEYATAGNYTIKLTVSSGRFTFYAAANNRAVLSATTYFKYSNRYSNDITSIRFGTQAYIGNYAFQYCTALTSVTLPDSLTNIGTCAFQGCYSLSSITIPNGVTSIGSSVCASCRALTSIVIPNGVTSIGSSMCSYCYSLRLITIPDGVTSIGGNFFSECSSLASIIIPDGVTSLGGNAFSGCRALTSITVPDGVTSIETSTFANCYTLTSLTIPDGVTSIKSSAFSSCYSLTSVTIPDGVTSIGNAFSNCSVLISVTIPDGVTSIASSTFSGCSSLISVTIPDSVTSIGSSAFTNCYALSSITIPDGVTSIAAQAFSSCYDMAEIHFLPTTPPTLANTNAFTNVPTTCIFYVPTGSLEAYQTATNWSTYADRMQEE